MATEIHHNDTAPPQTEAAEPPHAPEIGGDDLIVTVEGALPSVKATSMHVQCKSGFESIGSVKNGQVQIGNMPDEHCRVFFMTDQRRVIDGSIIGGGEWHCTLMTSDSKCRMLP